VGDEARRVCVCDVHMMGGGRQEGSVGLEVGTLCRGSSCLVTHMAADCLHGCIPYISCDADALLHQGDSSTHSQDWIQCSRLQALCCSGSCAGVGCLCAVSIVVFGAAACAPCHFVFVLRRLSRLCGPQGL
jgi:hypothetical protein